MIPITNYNSAYEVIEEGTLVFKNMPRVHHRINFEKLVDLGLARIVSSRKGTSGGYIDDTEVTFKPGMAIKIVKIKLSKAKEESSQYHWNDSVKFSILHPSLKGLQFKTVGRYDIEIHGRENMRELSKLKTEEIMD